MELEFKRFLPKCGHNDKAVVSGKTRDLIYNFEIFADGVKVGEWARIYLSKGYELCDAEGQIIKIKWQETDTWNSRVIKVKAQSEFEATTREFWKHIPTAEQIAERTQRALDDAAAAARKALEMEQLRRVMDAGPELLKALKYARCTVKQSDFDIEYLDKTIALAEGPATI